MPGFIPSSRASFVLDLIVLAMALVVPILVLSIYRVRVWQNIALHRLIQTTLGLVLGVAIIAFEWDMRINGWRDLAEPSPYYESWVFPALILHLCFAVPTLFLWTYTIIMALKHSIDQKSGKARFQHKKFGLLSSYSMVGTAVTGWIFYWLAFIAS